MFLHYIVKCEVNWCIPAGEEVSADGLLPFHHFGREVIYGRFEQLRTAMKGCLNLELKNSLTSPGAYAWIHCDKPCDSLINKVNLLGSSGKSYGTSDKGMYKLYCWNYFEGFLVK